MLKTDMNNRQLEVIETMRFPLMFLVLFIHMLPETGHQVEMQFSSRGIYSILSEMISHNLGAMAVPCFFLFSGFFFFYKMDKGWNINFYLTQLKKRCRTLLIPYVLWNLLAILAIFVKNYIFRLLAWESDDGLLVIQTTSWFDLLWSTPVDYPLWYIRDLMCMVILTPFFFFLFRYAKIYGLLILMLVYLSGWEANISGFSSTAFLFFGSGAYMALNKKNLLQICSKFRYPVAFAAIFFLCFSTFCNGTTYHIHIVRVFIILGIITAVNITNRLMCREKWKKMMCRLSVSTFFVYALHEIYIIGWLKGGFLKTPLAGNGWGMLFGYFLIPCICLLVCLALYFILQKLTPRLLSVLTGGRIASRKNHGENR